MSSSHRVGEEARIGNLGGGLVSADSHRNLIKAEDLCRRGTPEASVPYLVKALKDRKNLDALIQMAYLSPGGRPEAIKYLQEGEAEGKKVLKSLLGQKAFVDGGGVVGRFWIILQTRPYMRVLQNLGRMQFEEGKYDESARTFEEMLRLGPGDHMSQRLWLGPLLTQCGRFSNALFFAQAWWTKGVFPIRGGTLYRDHDPSVPSPMTDDELKRTPCNITYTAALASFKLYGDCEQSQTYLKMASTSNPGVLVKILTRRKRPDELNMSPRIMNGSEDGQDYLFMAQNLWMEDDVWNWANGSSSKDQIRKSCSRPECEKHEQRPGEFKRCGNCHKVSYCGQDCQKRHWKAHKSDCQLHKEIKSASKTFMKGKPAKEDSLPVYALDNSISGTHVFTNQPNQEGS